MASAGNGQAASMPRNRRPRPDGPQRFFTPAGRTLPIEEVGLEDFFRGLIQDREWHDADGKKTVENYRNLLTVLKEHLTDPKVFKVPKVE